jgi:hypothetical protein
MNTVTFANFTQSYFIPSDVNVGIVGESIKSGLRQKKRDYRKANKDNFISFD